MEIGLLKNLLTQNKAALIAAHQSQDWESAKVLSQQREKLKRQDRRQAPLYNHCACGQAISWAAVRCKTCFYRKRYYNHALTAFLLVLLVTGYATNP